MFYKYEIKNINGEDVLYLYLTMSYEFSRELRNNVSDKDMTRRTKNFIKNNNINYKGKKVFLVIDGMVVKSLDVSNNDNEIEILKENLYYSNEYYLVTVQLDNTTNVEMSLREFLLGLLASIYSEKLELETLKAITILFRTYVFKEMSEKRYIKAKDNMIMYQPISNYKLTWLVKYDETYNLLSKAIKDTDCLFLTYDNYYILPFMHYSNDGKTLSSSSYKYLSSVNSVWDLASPYYVNIIDFTYTELSKILKSEINHDSDIQVLEVDKNNFITKLKIDNNVFLGEDLVALLNLKSTNLHIIINKDYIRFITKGYGNYYGLSIFGANELIKNGCSYDDVLKYYFPLVKICKYIKELS